MASDNTDTTSRPTIVVDLEIWDGLHTEYDRLLYVLMDIWARMDSGINNPLAINSVSACLPAAGPECERKADEVVRILREALWGGNPVHPMVAQVYCNADEPLVMKD